MGNNKESSSSVVHECQYWCNSLKHGSNLTAALTKSSLSDEKVAAYIKWCCVRYAKACDLKGRRLIHLAAATGRLKLLKFLLKHKDVNINEKDKESRYTPLHFSLFNGHIHCAVRLIEQGANNQQLDFDELTPLDHVMKDRPIILKYDESQPCEVYVWGTNTNYTLGIGHHHSRTSPEPLDKFRRQGISITQVVMSKFHSAFISSDGRVWTCGHGQGGRLGLDDELTSLTPKPLRVGSSKCTFVDLGTDHTILLMADHSVLSCGLNSYHQLGHSPPPPKILSPKAIKSLKDDIIGISASRYHSAFWSHSALFTCGLNGGQLGHIKGSESTIIIPKIVTSLNLEYSRISLVASSDGAIVLANTNGEVYLFYEYQCRKIVTRSRRINPRKICVIGGHLDHKRNVGRLQEKGGDELKIVIISGYNKIYLWQESTSEASRCELSLHRKICITDAALNKNFFLLTTNDGEAFEGEIKVKKRKALPENEKLAYRRIGNENYKREECDYIKLKRIPHIHRGVKVTSDLKGRNLAITQVHPKARLFQIPDVSSSEMKENMKNLYDSTERFHDTLQDVTFEVEGHRFYAHKYIVAYSSSVLEEMMKEGNHSNGVSVVKIENVRWEIFRRILCFIYTRDCDFLHAGVCPVRIDFEGKGNENIPEIVQNAPEIPGEIMDYDMISAFEYNSKKLAAPKKRAVKVKVKDNPLKLLKSAARRFGLKDLQKDLETVRFENGYIFWTGKKKLLMNKPKFDQKLLQYLSDVSLKSEDGIEIKAHKCILASRLEYFDCMINQGWLESTQKTAINLPIPGKVLNVLINYLYTDEAPNVVNSEDLDLTVMTLVVAEQFFCTGLKEYAEFALANLTSLKNASEILQVASMYNAYQLKRCTMDFICLNLPAVLESRSLEMLSDSVLKDLTDFYRSWLPCFEERQISTYWNAPDDSLVDMIYNTEPVSLDTVDENLPLKLAQKTPKKKSREKRNSECEGMRNSSARSFTSEDEPEPLPTLDFCEDKKEEDEEAWVKVVSHSSKQQKNAHQKVRTPPVSSKLSSQPVQPDNFISLNKLSVEEVKNEFQSLEKGFQLTTNSEKEFPALNAPPPERTTNPHPPGSRQSHEVFRRFVKLSQKQRKRLANQSISEDEETPKKAEIPVLSPWGLTKTEPQLLTDIMKQESKANISGQYSAQASGAPWQDTKKPDSSLSAVMASERKQREQFARMKLKPLKYTQMEDKAMEDLLLFYNANDVPDERITVRRAEYEFLPTPVWVSNRK